VDQLQDADMTDLPVVAGGIIPEEDVSALKSKGIKEVFLPGTSLQDIVAYFENQIPFRS
jgi:methylmalonyl-CoA mutase C-terminal domain/subunit